MARRKLTALGIEALRAKDKYYEVVDTSGLRLGIQPLPSTTVSALTRYRRPQSSGGRPAKVTHGVLRPKPTISLAAARVAHAEALRKLAEGIDPGADKQRAKAQARQIKDDVVELHIPQHLERCRGEISDSHWKQTRYVLEGDVIAAWRGRPVSGITRRDIRELVEKIAKTRGPIAGNRAQAIVHRFFNTLIERDVLAASPCVGLKRPAKETARSRVLANGEIKHVHDALTTIGGPLAACALAMLYCGQRRGECANMRHSLITDGVWSLPAEKVKNRRPHVICLSRQMLDLIERQPVLGDLVFSYDGNRPASGFSHLKRQVDDIAKLETPWCWHDLRRTCASGMQKLGVRGEVIERALNHVSGSFRGVAGIYQRDPLTDEVRDALARWGDHVERIITGASAKIVKLRS
jgi:integrase